LSERAGMAFILDLLKQCSHQRFQRLVHPSVQLNLFVQSAQYSSNRPLLAWRRKWNIDTVNKCRTHVGLRRTIAKALNLAADLRMTKDVEEKLPVKSLRFLNCESADTLIQQHVTIIAYQCDFTDVACHGE